MDTYLTIMVTVLVVTQVIRVIQNFISLYKQRKEVEKNISWLTVNEVTEKDFEVQRRVFYLLYDRLVEDKKDSEEENYV